MQPGSALFVIPSECLDEGQILEVENNRFYYLETEKKNQRQISACMAVHAAALRLLFFSNTQKADFVNALAHFHS